MFKTTCLKLGMSFLLVMCLVSANPNQCFSEAVETATKTEPAYRIGTQNLLQIRILGEATVQQTYRVDDLGYITHPIVGRIKLAGQTVAQAEEMIENTLRGDYIRNPHITVFVVEHSRFSVLGEVREPGNYEIIGQVNIVEAISMAGGFTPVANEKKVRVIRKISPNEEKAFEVNVQDIIDGKRSENVPVEAGDVISVSKSFF